jgi:hypothetical protein
MHAKPITICGCAAWLGLLCAGPVAAHDLSANECLEGADFIEHAAMSRDHGLSRDDFIRRMQEDIQAIQAFPPALRWFVQDAADEELLLGAALRVFDSPRTPEDHRNEFVQVCSERLPSKFDADAGMQPTADELEQSAR